MAEEAKQTTAPAAPVPEVVEKDIPAPEPEAVVEKPAPVSEVEKPAEKEEESKVVVESASFKEESNVVADLPNPQQKALDELKKLVREALDKHELTTEKKSDPEPSPAPPSAVEEEKKKKESPEEEKKEDPAAPAPVSAPEETLTEKKKEEEEKESEAPPPPPPAQEAPPAAEKEVVIEEKAEEKAAEEGTKTVEEVKDIVEVTTTIAAAAEPPPPPPAAEEEEEEKKKPKEETAAPAPAEPEEVSIWGIKLLEDERSDTILLKFLRARDFKVKEAFAMLKSVVAWRKEFKIDELLEEEATQGLEKVVYLHGKDKEGHPVIYNAFGEFQTTFADAEKRSKFLRGMIQFLEKTIRGLDFSPDGVSTLFQVIDLKNSQGLFFFKKDLRQAINHALQLFQDNYPEFVAKQVYLNVPWWYPAYYRMTNAIFTPRTKSKFVFAGPSRSAETLFRYIAPEQVPVQYGGLSRESEQEFTAANAATEEIIKPASKHKVEFEVSEKCTLVWETRVVGWDVTYGAEFVPSAEEGYTVIVQKTRKVGGADETIISTSYNIGEPGKVVVTIDNQTSKRKKLVYRSKSKPLE